MTLIKLNKKELFKQKNKTTKTKKRTFQTRKKIKQMGIKSPTKKKATIRK